MPDWVILCHHARREGKKRSQTNGKCVARISPRILHHADNLGCEALNRRLLGRSQ